MPHAIATRISYIWYHADRHEQQWKRDLGLALAPKTCPDHSQASKEAKNSQRFTLRRKKKTTSLFFSTSRFQVFQGMVLQSFAQPFEELTA